LQLRFARLENTIRRHTTEKGEARMSAQQTNGANFSREEILSFCRAVANIIAADRKISDEERAHLAEVIQELGLSVNDPEVQRAIYSQLSSPSPIDEVVKSVKHPVLRRNLYRTLIEVAVSDGLHRDEENKLAKLAATFELNEKAARELVQWTVKSIELDKQEDEILKRL
jgi:uncharacterized membrane protein YebE (DUF533 family)